MKSLVTLVVLVTLAGAARALPEEKPTRLPTPSRPAWSMGAKPAEAAACCDPDCTTANAACTTPLPAYPSPSVTPCAAGSSICTTSECVATGPTWTPVPTATPTTGGPQNIGNTTLGSGRVNGQFGVLNDIRVTTGADTNGYSVGSASVYIGTNPDGANIALALYTSASPHVLLCSATTFVGTGTHDAYVPLALSGCGTLAATTNYWVGFWAQNNNMAFGVDGTACGSPSPSPLSESTGSITALPLPNPWTPASTTGNCNWSLYLTVTGL